MPQPFTYPYSSSQTRLFRISIRLSTHPSIIHLFIHLTIYLSIHPLTHLPTYLPTYSLPNSQSTHLYTYPSVYPIHSPIHLPIHLPHRPIHLLIHPSICYYQPSTYEFTCTRTSMHLPIYLATHLSFNPSAHSPTYPSAGEIRFSPGDVKRALI